MSLYESLTGNIGIGMPAINKQTIRDLITQRNFEYDFKEWVDDNAISMGSGDFLSQIDKYASKELKAQGYDIEDCDCQMYNSYMSIRHKCEVGVIRDYYGEARLELVIAYINDNEIGIIDVPAAKRLFDQLNKVFKKYHKVTGRDYVKLTPYRVYSWSDSKGSIIDLFF